MLQTGAAQTGLGALSGLFDLGLAPFLAQFAPLQAQAGLLSQQPVFSGQSSGQQALGGINAAAGLLSGIGGFGTGAANVGRVFGGQTSGG
jgi:hypothetical protein